MFKPGLVKAELAKAELAKRAARAAWAAVSLKLIIVLVKVV